MKVLLKYPTRERPKLFKETVAKWEEMLSSKNTFHWLFSMDADDPTTLEYDFPNSKFKHSHTLNVEPPRGKIGACNAFVNQAIEKDSYDMVWLVSDDMVPEVQDFDLIIQREMETHYSDYDGAVHINDGLQGLRLCTFSCMGVPYYKRFGYFYHPDYKSCFCDDEYTQISWAQRRMIWIPDVLVRHRWVGHTVNDSLHQKNHNIMQDDLTTYKKRVSLGFPKQSVL